jgi:hypothetical protein
VEAIPHNPSDGVYAATDDYVHGIEVRGAERLLLIAGTMGLRLVEIEVIAAG